MRFLVLDNEDHAAVVEAPTECEAAKLGATELGMRWRRRKPHHANQWNGMLASWNVYGPSFKGHHYVIGTVYVYSSDGCPQRHRHRL